MWNRYKQTADFRDGKPWLLRFFDQIRFYPVTEEELLKMREDFPRGRFRLRVEETTFSLREYQSFLNANADSIGAFKRRQQAAFEAERERWKALGQAEYASDAMVAGAASDSELDLPEHGRAVGSPVSGNVWKVQVAEGDRVKSGDVLVIVESMKMEIAVEAPCDGQVFRLFCREATPVTAGQDLLILLEGMPGKGDAR
ncbi:MAG: acetyl-CoA carboxylase biotin carboxyl carrier protein subunit, partial [Pseudomonadota bacterium]